MTTPSRERLAALDISVDETGNRLAHAIGAARDEWGDALGSAAAELVANLQALLDDAKVAAEELGRVRAAESWLSGWDTGQAIVGRGRKFHGGSAPLRARLPKDFSNRDPSVDELLAVASVSLEPAAPAEPRTATRAESRFSGSRARGYA